MRVWALAEEGHWETIDLFVRREDAERALKGCLRDEPDWKGLLRIEQVELAAGSAASN